MQEKLTPRIAPDTRMPWLSRERPCPRPATPDHPWLTGLTEAVAEATGERYALDLSCVTQAWLEERLGVRASPVLTALEYYRAHMTEESFAFILAGIAGVLIYGD